MRVSDAVTFSTGRLDGKRLLAPTRQRLAPEAACALGLHGTCDLEIDRAISAVGSREIRQVAIESPSAAPIALDSFDRTTTKHQKPSRIDAKRGNHFLQDFPLPIQIAYIRWLPDKLKRWHLQR